ncbi:hypothetical protein HDU76_005531 [Blyttiomyces sp. JEL0837]|nr:hypothetical protein HDU76_005531 [Blyttiomyces sp. JEL0837]
MTVSLNTHQPQYKSSNSLSERFTHEQQNGNISDTDLLSRLGSPSKLKLLGISPLTFPRPKSQSSLFIPERPSISVSVISIEVQDADDLDANTNTKNCVDVNSKEPRSSMVNLFGDNRDNIYNSNNNINNNTGSLRNSKTSATSSRRLLNTQHSNPYHQSKSSLHDGTLAVTLPQLTALKATQFPLRQSQSLLGTKSPSVTFIPPRSHSNHQDVSFNAYSRESFEETNIIGAGANRASIFSAGGASGGGGGNGNVVKAVEAGADTASQSSGTWWTGGLDQKPKSCKSNSNLNYASSGAGGAISMVGNGTIGRKQCSAVELKEDVNLGQGGIGGSVERPNSRKGFGGKLPGSKIWGMLFQRPRFWKKSSG